MPLNKETRPNRVCSRGVMVKAVGCGIEENEFELQSCYYVQFQTNVPLGKVGIPLSSQQWVKLYHYCSS